MARPGLLALWEPILRRYLFTRAGASGPLSTTQSISRTTTVVSDIGLLLRGQMLPVTAPT